MPVPPDNETPDPRFPVEGVDYYLENGRWVFTAAFLLRRGYCCNSGCRHCPYRETKDKDERPASAG